MSNSTPTGAAPPRVTRRRALGVWALALSTGPAVAILVLVALEQAVGIRGFGRAVAYGVATTLALLILQRGIDRQPWPQALRVALAAGAVLALLGWWLDHQARRREGRPRDVAVRATGRPRSVPPLEGIATSGHLPACLTRAGQPTHRSSCAFPSFEQSRSQPEPPHQPDAR